VQRTWAAGFAPERLHRTSGMILRPDFYTPPLADKTTLRRVDDLGPDTPTGLVLFGGPGSRVTKPISASLRDKPLVLVGGRNDALAAELRATPATAPRVVDGLLHSSASLLGAAVAVKEGLRKSLRLSVGKWSENRRGSVRTCRPTSSTLVCRGQSCISTALASASRPDLPRRPTHRRPMGSRNLRGAHFCAIESFSYYVDQGQGCSGRWEAIPLLARCPIRGGIEGIGDSAWSLSLDRLNITPFRSAHDRIQAN